MTDEAIEERVRVWPPGVSDGLTLPCADCGEVPRFDYIVADDFWRQHVERPAYLGVVCLPCLDSRCGGVGLAAALREVQWTGSGHTVVLRPTRRYAWDGIEGRDRDSEALRPDSQPPTHAELKRLRGVEEAARDILRDWEEAAMVFYPQVVALRTALSGENES